MSTQSRVKCARLWMLSQLQADEIRPIETVLAKYLGLEPSSVRPRRSPEGKAELQGSAFRVNLAHSGDVALVAVGRGRDIGVDVEVLGEGTEKWSLVRHALTADESAQLQTLPVSQRSRAFLQVWTRKEALLKAAGVGLSVDPQLIELEGASVVSVCGSACSPRAAIEGSSARCTRLIGGWAAS
jgi:4'-phosphopantetheinyl transferase